MELFARATLLTGAAAIALIPTPAMAQSAEPPAAEAAAEPPATEAPAQAAVEPPAAEAAAEDGGDIVVTARRRDELLQDVPIAVTAYSGTQLQREGAVDITDIGDTTPNVTLENSRATNSTLTAFIRGIGQQDPVAGFEQGVGLYLDDVYLNRPQGSVLDIYDVERIEILRGPQGTLYGRNTIGGAIKYVTRRLSAEPRVEVRGTVGTYGQLDGVATVSYPIADIVRVGASAARLYRNGFGNNITVGEDNYDKNVVAGRISAEIGRDDSALLRLSGDYTRDTSHARGGHRLIPGLLSGTPVDDDVFDSFGGQSDPRQKVTNKGAAAHGQLAVAEGIKLKSITAYRKDNSRGPIDFDATPLVDVDVPGIYKNKQFSQEFQLEVERGALSGVAGVYYLDADAQTLFDVRLFTTFTSPTLGGFAAFTNADVNTKTWAVFGDFTYDINQQFAVSVGARYTDDRRKASIFRQSYLGNGSPIFGGLGIPFGAATSDFDGKRTDTAFTPRASVSYKPNDDHHFYASYAKGFKGGGFDPRGSTTAAPDLNGDGTVDDDEIYDYMTFEPEKVTSYELGWKGSFLDKRVSAGLALFHADYQDMQIPASNACVDANGNASFCGETSNAGKARIRGIEFEGNARLFGEPGGSRLNFAWSLGYLDAKFKEYKTFLLFDENLVPFAGGPQPVDLADFRKVQNTPKWTASGTLSYATRVAGGALNLNSTLAYRSKSQQFETPIPQLDQKGFALWSAGATYDLPGNHWTVGVYGKNLTDKKYVTAGYNFLYQNPYTGEFIGNGIGAGPAFGVPGYDAALGREGVLTAYYGNPRQVFFTLGYKF
ncbi:TonB-dependent receptor [Sphingomonas sp.]|uniref:TonB-dependent receptor n=1 Tax=Sphingomonas sp. TaxID=28214 RepID=UPI0038F63758